MDLTKKQKNLFDQIKSPELKKLLTGSYTIFSMSDEEKDEFLAWASSIHDDKNAEKELIQTLKNEAKERDEVLNDPGNTSMTQEEKVQLKEVIEREYLEMKQYANKLKTEVNKEKEKEERREDKKKIDSLTKQLNKI